MTERERACVITTIGAIAGALTSYLLLTERGRLLRRQLLQALDGLDRELNELRATVARTTTLAGEGWKLLQDAVGEGAATSPAPRPRQTAPF